jgi:hypothetical protein
MRWWRVSCDLLVCVLFQTVCEFVFQIEGSLLCMRRPKLRSGNHKVQSPQVFVHYFHYLALITKSLDEGQFWGLEL